jgi:hypothetical protein
VLAVAGAKKLAATHNPIKIIVKWDELVSLHPVHNGNLEHFHRRVEKPLIIRKASCSSDSVNQEFVLQVDEHEVSL